MQLIIMFLISLLIIHLIKIYNYKYICYIYNCGKTNGYENKYNPDKWNDNEYIRKSHNCYAYALNNINKKLTKQCQQKCTGVNPQPGHYCNNKYNKIFCYDIEKAMICDNSEIKISSFNQKCSNNFYKIGLSVQNNINFHFYKQNLNGIWSHKDAGFHVNNLDSNKKIIINPKESNRNFGKYRNYKKWCNFYCVPTINTNMSRNQLY